MLIHYFITFYRNLFKYKLFSFIILLGLAVGMASFLLIVHYVLFESSFDTFHKNADYLYRVERKITSQGQVHYLATNALIIGQLMKQDIPGVMEFARLHPKSGYGVVQYNDKSFFERKIFYADSTFLTLFAFDMVQGNAADALRKPNSVVLTESTARKYFGDEDAMGKEVMVLGKYMNNRCKVTGVVKDVPPNSHIQFDVLSSIHHFLHSPVFGDGWDNTTFHVYVLLHPSADPQALQAGSYEFFKKYRGEYFRQYNYKEEFVLSPIKSIHLYSTVHGQLQEIKNGNYKAVYYVSVLAFLILLIAWMNYLNLTTARLIERLKEVGLRKVVGARPEQLMRQLLFEAAAANILTFAIALLMIQLMTPGFNRFIGLPASLSPFANLKFWIILLGIFAISMAIMGIYFVFVVSSFKTAEILKSLSNLKIYGSMNLRRALIVFQLVFSIFFISGTLTVYNQIAFIKNKDLGFDKDNILLVRQPYVASTKTKLIREEDQEDLGANMTIFDNEIVRIPGVDGSTRSVYFPGDDYGQSALIRRVTDDPTNLKSVNQNMVNNNFFDFYKIQFIAGRSFSEESGTDDETVILNEDAAKLLGFQNPEEAVNQFIMWAHQEGFEKREIIGVIKNYHQESLRNTIEPLIFILRRDVRVTSAIKLTGLSMEATIQAIESRWKEIFPGIPFEYYFLDSFIDRLYANDQILGRVFGTFSLIAILLTCFGLFALSLYSAIRRTKEIGIRKVLGAGSKTIIWSMLKDFVYLLLGALVVALPLAYIISKRWLHEFAYQIKIGWWFFLSPTIIITVITLLTVSYHALKVAKTNPSLSLRYE